MIEATDWRAVDCDAGLRKTEQHISIEALAEQVRLATAEDQTGNSRRKVRAAVAEACAIRCRGDRESLLRHDRNVISVTGMQRAVGRFRHRERAGTENFHLPRTVISTSCARPASRSVSGARGRKDPHYHPRQHPEPCRAGNHDER
jgi:hypothetical protein